jgi:hypothetical protein
MSYKSFDKIPFSSQATHSKFGMTITAAISALVFGPCWASGQCWLLLMKRFCSEMKRFLFFTFRRRGLM